jgi:hypothetical protein
MEFVQYLTPTHQEILEVLNQANVAVIEHHKICGSKNQWDGWTITIKDRKNDLGKTILAMCTDTTKNIYEDWQSEINRTFAHESVHVAQICKSGDGHIRPLGFRKDIEKEAFAIQDNPREVLRILKKYCL